MLTGAERWRRLVTKVSTADAVGISDGSAIVRFLSSCKYHVVRLFCEDSPRLSLEHKGNEPFRALYILSIARAQVLLEDALFYMDTVAEAKQGTSHDDEQTQPVVRQAESKSEQREEEAGIRRDAE